MTDTVELLPVLFRRYAAGDVIALFPTEPGDPAGGYAVAIGGTDKLRHYPAEVGSVMASTDIATTAQAKRLKTNIVKEFGYELDERLTLTADEVAEMATIREGKKAEYARFEKIRHLY